MKDIQDSLIQDPFFDFMSLFKDHKNYQNMLPLHCEISGLQLFADGHIGLLSQFSLLVFLGCLLILKDIEFNVKVTSKYQGELSCSHIILKNEQKCFPDFALTFSRNQHFNFQSSIQSLALTRYNYTI